MSPDRRQHRGAHPDDAHLFTPDTAPTLRRAVGDLSWLLSRNYTPTSALKLVGDRYNLNERQRVAIARASCSDQGRAHRHATRLPVEAMRGAEVAVDGFNLLITVEAALSRAVILVCRDGCMRDLASVHGSYRSVQETGEALEMIGEVLTEMTPTSVEWLLDSPVSNSGRLAQRLREIASERGWPWHTRTVIDPDPELIASDRIVVSSDSVILDRVGRWADLASYIICRRVKDAWRVDLRDPSQEGDMS